MSASLSLAVWMLGIVSGADAIVGVGVSVIIDVSVTVGIDVSDSVSVVGVSTKYWHQSGS